SLCWLGGRSGRPGVGRCPAWGLQWLFAFAAMVYQDLCDLCEEAIFEAEAFGFPAPTEAWFGEHVESAPERDLCTRGGRHAGRKRSLHATFSEWAICVTIDEDGNELVSREQPGARRDAMCGHAALFARWSLLRKVVGRKGGSSSSAARRKVSARGAPPLPCPHPPHVPSCSQNLHCHPATDCTILCRIRCATS
ncbi:unnamed protein product, partial [Prorocentrum cordatum]